MSSVDVLKKKESKCFVRKKNLSVRRKIFKVWRGGGEYLSMEFRVFEKKELEGKFWKKKNQSVSCGEKKIKIFVVKEKLKLGENIQVVSNFSWALCWLKSSITWINLER